MYKELRLCPFLLSRNFGVVTNNTLGLHLGKEKYFEQVIVLKFLLLCWQEASTGFQSERLLSFLIPPIFPCSSIVPRYHNGRNTYEMVTW